MYTMTGSYWYEYTDMSKVSFNYFYANAIPSHKGGSYNLIFDPVSNRKVSIHSKRGHKILKK